MVGLALKWVRLDPKSNKSWTFSDQISVHLARWAKCTEICSEKVMDFSNLGSNWPTLEPNLPSLVGKLIVTDETFMFLILPCIFPIWKNILQRICKFIYVYENLNWSTISSRFTWEQIIFLYVSFYMNQTVPWCQCHICRPLYMCQVNVSPWTLCHLELYVTLTSVSWNSSLSFLSLFELLWIFKLYLFKLHFPFI